MGGKIELKLRMDKYLEHIDSALKLARYALDHGETPVACVFVHEKSDSVVAYGLNDTNDSLSGTAHAEFVAMRMLRDAVQAQGYASVQLKQLFKEIVCYVTVEPCIMCASALKQMGIHKIVFGCGNDRFGGNGTVLSIHSDKSTTVAGSTEYDRTILVPGIRRREAIMLLRYFYVRENDRAPKPRTKAERNLDKNTFPPMQWCNYLTRDDFTTIFGEPLISKYDNNEDLAGETINWDMIDNSHDSIINELQRESQNFELFLQNKKHKHST